MSSAENGKTLTLAETQRRLERNEKNIDDLFTKYEGVGKTNWTIVLSAVGVMITGGTIILGAIITPINSQLARHEGTFALYVTQDSSKEYRKRVDDALERVDRELQASSNRLNLRIDEVRRDLGSTYNFGDKIKEMEREFDTLRDRMWKTFVPPPQAQPKNGH